MRTASLALAPLFSLAAYASTSHYGVRGDLHFPLHARATNNDGSLPLYKNPHASIEDRVNDLLPRMTLEEKVAQLYVEPRSFTRSSATVEYSQFHLSIQGDMNGWMNFNDPLDDTLTFNQTGLVRVSAVL